MSVSTAATVIGALSTAGLEGYEVSQGQPVSISSVGGIGTVSVGSVFTGLSGTLIIIVLAVVAGIFLLRGHR